MADAVEICRGPSDAAVMKRPGTRQWFCTAVDVIAPTSRVDLWIGAASRSEAAAVAATISARWNATPDAARGDARAHVAAAALQPFALPATPMLHEEILELAARDWGVVAGCLVQLVPDADVIAAEWLELCEGEPRPAEAALNRVHLWDLLDDDSTPELDREIATGLACAWQDTLALLPGVAPIVIELHTSGDGPHLTVFREPRPVTLLAAAAYPDAAAA